MGSSFKLKNGQDQEFSIVHNDNAGAITVASDKIVVKDSNGNVVLASGSKIQGDFSNGNNSLRTAFQTSTSNGNTIVSAIPNGTGTSGVLQSENNSDSSNSSYGRLQCTPSEVRITSGINGAGTYLPITLITNNTERMRIDTNGNVGIGDSNPQYRLSINSATALGQNAGDSLTNISKYTNVVGNASYLRQITYRHTAGNTHDGTDERIQKQVDATPMGYIAFGNNSVKLGINSGDALVVDDNRNVLLTTGTGGLGYGTGAGGTVTQAISKSRTVTLNKPSGKITMHNAALPAGANVTFTLNNSLLNSNDTIHITFDGFSASVDVYIIRHTVINGAAYINIINNTASSRSEAMVLNFVIIKGAIV